GAASGSGNGSITYVAAINTDTNPRTGTLTAGGNTFTVTQAGNVCLATLSGTSSSVGSIGFTGVVSVTAGAGCGWTAVSNVAWLTITAGASGSGSGSVTYSVAANTGTSARTGTFTVGGNTFTVAQAAPVCTVSLSST